MLEILGSLLCVPDAKDDSVQRIMHRVTPILQHLWQDVADPRGFVVLEAFDGCDNLSLRDFWVRGV